MIVTVAMMWFRRNLALRKKKAASKFSCFNSNNKHRKRRYIQRSPKVLKNYQESNWAQMLQLGRCQDPSSKDGKLFRRRFRIPYPLFLEIVEVVRIKNWFPEVDCTGAPSAPLELKILGVLRVLGRGMCFDGIQELTNIDEETVRRFFHVFCERFAVEFFAVGSLYERFALCSTGQLSHLGNSHSKRVL